MSFVTAGARAVPRKDRMHNFVPCHLNNETICQQTVSNDSITSAKKTDGRNPNSDHHSVPLTISTKEDYVNLVPPLSTHEYELLKESIRENGLHVAIIVNQKGIILDGV